MALANIPKPKLAKGKKVFLVSPSVAPQTIAVLQTRATGFGIELKIAESNASLESEVEQLGEAKLLGALLQYPDVNGEIGDFGSVAQKVKAAGGKTVVASDLLALTMLKPPGEWGADMVCGSSQRFGASPPPNPCRHFAYPRCPGRIWRTARGVLLVHGRAQAKAAWSDCRSKQGCQWWTGLPTCPPE